jgi:hypothetical protein
MSSVIPLPTLSTFGWVKNPAEHVDFALTHMFYADKFQTSLYGNNITSIPWILEETSGSIDQATVSMRQAINNYLSRYYDSVKVNVSTVEENSETSSTKIRMSLEISIVQNGIEYQVSRLVSLINGRFKEFINLNNNTV